MKRINVIIEKRQDGYVAYPLGIEGTVVGQGDSYEEALNDVKSAIKFHLETFGPESVDLDEPVLEAFVAETVIRVGSKYMVYAHRMRLWGPRSEVLPSVRGVAAETSAGGKS